MTDNNEYMTIPQAAEYMNISRQQMYAWSRVAGLKKYHALAPKSVDRKGGRIYFKRAEIDEKRGQFIEVE